MVEEIKIPDGVMLELYKDALQPAARIFGKFLGEATNRRIQNLKSNLSRTAEKLAHENSENIVSPKFDVAMPIVEKMRNTEENELVEAYAELLKNSCLKNRQGKVLPSYSTMLSNLTSDEIRILNYIYGGGVSCVIASRDGSESKSTTKYNGFPVLEILGQTPNMQEWFLVARYFNDLDKRVSLSNSSNIATYIHNLQALGIFSIPIKNSSYDPTIYKDLEEDARRIYQKSIEQRNRLMVIENGAIELTPIAKSFLAVCTSSNSQQRV